MPISAKEGRSRLALVRRFYGSDTYKGKKFGDLSPTEKGWVTKRFKSVEKFDKLNKRKNNKVEYISVKTKNRKEQLRLLNKNIAAASAGDRVIIAKEKGAKFRLGKDQITQIEIQKLKSDKTGKLTGYSRKVYKVKYFLRKSRGLLLQELLELSEEKIKELESKGSKILRIANLVNGFPQKSPRNVDEFNEKLFNAIEGQGDVSGVSAGDMIKEHKRFNGIEISYYDPKEKKTRNKRTKRKRKQSRK